MLEQLVIKRGKSGLLKNKEKVKVILSVNEVKDVNMDF